MAKFPAKTQVPVSFAKNESFASQSKISVCLGFLIIAAWLALHIFGIFGVDLATMWPLALPLIAVQCWLYVGLFILAHDCMHGSFTPSHARLNQWIGRLVLLLYAGFWFDALCKKHHAHHRHAGTALDPDFDPRAPHGFWRWYAKFFAEYFTWRQPCLIGGALAFYAIVLHAPLLNLLAFWALPALLSSLQLFTFGTYLPHRPDEKAFDDRHNARTHDFSWGVSLMTCFHFGYHHEHHLEPRAPWWALPRIRAKHKLSNIELNK